MTTCRRASAVYLRAAAGEGLSPELGAHATTCLDCRTALARAGRFVAALDRSAAGFTSPAMPTDLIVPTSSRAQIRVWSRAGALAAAVAAIVVGVALAGGYGRLVGGPSEASGPSSSPMRGGVPAASSCGDGNWPVMTVSCAEAQQSVSLGATSTRQARIWLTTLSAVDAQFAPPRQVADHPVDPNTPVWVFIYDADHPGIIYSDEAGQLQTSPPEQRLLHVTDATNPATRDGAFVYLYGWSELGSPDVPATMPAVQD